VPFLISEATRLSCCSRRPNSGRTTPNNNVQRCSAGTDGRRVGDVAALPQAQTRTAMAPITNLILSWRRPCRSGEETLSRSGAETAFGAMNCKANSARESRGSGQSRSDIRRQSALHSIGQPLNIKTVPPTPAQATFGAGGDGADKTVILN